MEVIIAAAISSIAPIIAVWHRTNGKGPISKKIDCLEKRIIRIEDRMMVKRGLD